MKSVLKSGSSVSFLALVTVLLGLLIAMGPLAYADTEGTIRGTVVDASGAAVAGADVKIVNIATNLERDVKSGDAGIFVAPSLAPGTYDVSVTKSGFRTFKQTGIKLESAATYVVTASLEVGEMSATVEVTAAKLQADTTTMQMGGELATGDLTNFPLLNRAWINLQTTLPGVVASSDRFTSNFATNGSRTQSNNYLVNGTDSNDAPLNTPIANAISPDAIQEVKVVDSTLNPEYGRNSGATLMVTTKSGTNEFHGSAFEFYRDTFMNARNFFSPVGPGSVPPFHQNQFGGTVGGPMWKNKLFFFFSYQGTRQFAGAATQTPVFTAAQRTGDFSNPATDSLATSTGVSPFPMFGDSASPCPATGTTMCPAGTPYGGSGGLFSTGVVPSQDLNPLAVKLMNQFVPAANTPGNLYSFPNNTVQSPDQYVGRLDSNLTSKDQINFYLFWDKSATIDTLPFTGATLPGFSETDTSKIYQYTASETHTFSSQWLNELRFGYNRFNFDAVAPTTPILPSSYCATSANYVGGSGNMCFQINSQNGTGAGLPFIGVTSYFSLGFSTNGPQPRIDDTGELIDNVSFITGTHAYKWGIDFRRIHVSNPFNFVNNGFYSMDGGAVFDTGDTAADFLLGISDGYEQSSGNFIDARSWEYYSYVQDQWKIRPNFTLTYGSGWQIDTPLTDHQNHGLAINQVGAGQQSTVFPTAPTGLLFPGDSGVNSAGYFTHLNNFAPRFGFAWHVRNKLTLRGGWGIYYDNSEEELTLQNLLAPPFALIDFGAADAGGSPSFAAPFTSINPTTLTVGGAPAPAVSIANKYPFTPAKAGQAVNWPFFEPFSLNVVDPRFNTPYIMNRQLSVQYQFTPSILGTFGYVGSDGRRLEGVVETAPYSASACLATPGCVAGRANEWFFNVGTQAAFPSPIFGSIGEQCTCLHSNYNAFEATLEKALGHGLQLRASYTYSHSLDNASSFENAQGSVIPGNFNATYGDSAFDARQRLVLQYLYQIPDWSFHHLPSKVTKGWTFSGLSTFQTGFPITLTESTPRSLQCSSNVSFYGCYDRPNVVGPVQIFSNPRQKQSITLPQRAAATNGNFYFNPDSFVEEGCTSATQAVGTCAFGQLGDAGRNFFHGPGINSTDLSFYKNTAITERMNFQLRVDLFNAFNHANFANPSGNISSSLFGRVTATRTGDLGPRITQLSASFTF